MRNWLRRIRQLFNRGRERDPLLSDLTPEQHLADEPIAEQDRELDEGRVPRR